MVANEKAPRNVPNNVNIGKLRKISKKIKYLSR